MNRGGLSEIALLFLKLGVTGFGGPAAHINASGDVTGGFQDGNQGGKIRGIVRSPN